MANKWNNKRLSIIFIVLIASFFIIRYLNSNRSKGNFNPDIISLDSAEIDEILLYPKVTNQEEIRFFRDGGSWMVQKGDFTAKAMQSTVESLVKTVQNIKPSRLAARSEEKWEKFHVNDSLSTKLIIKKKEGEDLGIVIGKFNYKQPQAQNPYQQQRVQSTSFFRLIDEEEVYATDGFLSMTFNRDINSFRDQTFLKLEKENVKKMSFNMPGDSYTLNKVDTIWRVNNTPADNAKVEQLINKMAMNNQNQFMDDFSPSNDAEYTLELSGDNMVDISLKVYPQDSLNVIMNSSLNPDAMFRVQREALFNDLFKSADYYMDSTAVQID